MGSIHTHSQGEKIEVGPLGKKGLFVGYSEQSKAYRIYIPGYPQIELSRDVKFDEDTTFRKSRKNQEDEEERETPIATKISKPAKNNEEERIPEDHDMIEPRRHKEFPSEMISCKRRPT